MSERSAGAMADGYDREAEATGWFGPEVAFGLAYKFIEPGESILDLGIGSGLSTDLFRKAGLTVHGLDVSEEMLEICRKKGIKSLAKHDLSIFPYPFDSRSMDNVISTGVFNFIRDLGPLFSEAGRIIRTGGLFIFAAGDRTENEPEEFTVGREHTGGDFTITMYMHSPEQINRWMNEAGFTAMRDLAITVYMDSGKRHSRQVRIYLCRKGAESR